MQIFIKNGDITTYENKVDVIVNAWNRNFVPRFLLQEAGVSKAIRKKAGHAPFEELRKKGLLHLGEAVMTSPGLLKCKALIHVAGLNFLWKSTEQSIRLSIYNALKLLIKTKFKSIAIPIIGSGTGSFHKEKCLDFIKEECRKFINYDIDVYIINYESSL